ncbi:MAG: hypothetical protein NUV85_00970, partial [Candidatus Berkelbacteria bacterium]|nr:hypothetical protein [Candidatus Berkelbacteria bacterium]
LGAIGYYGDKKTLVADNAKNSAPSSSSSPTATTTSTALPTLKLEDYSGGFFTIKKPVDWTVTVGGSCSTFSFVIHNPSNPAQMIMYFGEVGPVYLSEKQRMLDKSYMDMGGYKIAWYDMPVVSPLTPENFLKTMSTITSTPLVQQFMTNLPQLKDVDVISSTTAISPVSGTTKLMRAVFIEKGIPANGLFFLTTTVVLPETGMASSGIGYGMTFIGISSGRAEFTYLEKPLNDSLKSLDISQDYVSKCIGAQNAQTQNALKTSKTLSETSDIITQGYDNRNKSDDIISEKRSDVMLGRDRVYDPDTGNVYDVKNGWYDSYNINRQEFKMNNLEQLPQSDWNLWTSPTKDAKEID